MLQAIIFDMDGVLVNTGGSIDKSFNMVLAKYGARLDPSQKQKFLGRSLHDQLIMMKKDNPQIPQSLSVDEFGREAFRYQMELMQDILVPNEELLLFLREIREKGISLAVATSSSRYRAEILLERIGVLDLLDALVTAEDVTRHKPFPDVFLEAAHRISIEPSNCVVVEDALNGIQAANTAGMKSIAVVTPNHSKEDFYEANYVITDLSQMNITRITSENFIIY